MNTPFFACDGQDLIPVAEVGYDTQLAENVAIDVAP
jgi:hypothetical protein